MMNIELESLVQQIAQKVITELGTQEQQKSILVFAKKGHVLPQVIQEQAGEFGRLLCYDDSYELDKIDRFILPFLYIDQMVDLAMGKGGSKLMHSVRQVLLAGREVEVAEFEYRQFINTTPAALTSMYEEYHKKLKSFGLVSMEKKESRAKYLTGGLLTEEDVMLAHRESIPYLEVTNSCCVTPLAFDCAREHSIVIKRVTGGPK